MTENSPRNSNATGRNSKYKVAEKGVDGKIAYWDFIGADTYEETVQRAFLTSFLITYGYATLEIDRLEETVFILPFDKPRREALTEQSTSVPIAVSVEDWQKWKRGKQAMSTRKKAFTAAKSRKQPRCSSTNDTRNQA